jgi:hypothetical protein
LPADTEPDGRDFMKYAFEMGSGAMTYEYIPSFLEMGLYIERLVGERDSKENRHSTEIA